MNRPHSHDFPAGRYARTFAAFLLAALAGAALAAPGPSFRAVDLDEFIRTEKTRLKGHKTITLAKPVSFVARVKRHPEPREMKYVYVALELSGVDPLPEVEHRLFVESDGGRIIPVYVEKTAAARITERLKVEQRARFNGLHVYNYAKGPAILVVGFRPLREGE